MSDALTAAELLHAAALWRYCCVQTPVSPADFVLALGCHDERVAEHAADLVLGGVAPLLIVAGGFGKITRREWCLTEAERFADIALARGVRPDRLIREDRSSNTAENIRNVRALTAARHAFTAGVLVTKPYMARRALATAQRQWGEIAWQVTFAASTLDNYATAKVPLRRAVSLMVGEIIRLQRYAERGHVVAQQIPPAVWDSYRALVASGFSEFTALA
jgi:uncharacterized SAM-binding protein YcdF (DUF218 family)